MTNDIIDNVLTAIGETHDVIDALDGKTRRTRADLQERLRLLRQLQSLEKQFASFGKRGRERQNFHDDKTDAYFAVWMDVDPERVAWARAFLAKHDPEHLRKMDAKTRDDEYQQKRLTVIRYMYAEAPRDVQEAMVRRFLKQVRDDAGNLPDWIERRFPQKEAITEMSCEHHDRS